MLSTPRFAFGEVYNTVLQEVVEADWVNLFSVDDGERNPYTEMLHGEVNVDLLSGVSENARDWKTVTRRNVWLQYEPKSKTIIVRKSKRGPAIFDMRKDEFVDTFEVECIDR